MKLACISGRYLRFRARAAAQSFERAARVRRHFVRDFVGGDGDNADAAERDDRERDRVVPGENEERLGHQADRLRDLGHIAAGFFTPTMLGISARRTRVAGSRFAAVRLGTL